MHNDIEEFRPIKINNIDYILKTSFFITGPYISIRDKNNIAELANVVIDRFKDNVYMFDIKVHDNKLRNKGIGTFLMCEAAKWCHVNSIPLLCGKLDWRDKTINHWETSLPFYNKLPHKAKFIKRCYFLQSLKDLETPKNLKKKAKSLKEIFETGGIVIFLIK